MSREAFEKWYMSRGWVDTFDPLMKHDHGAYIVAETCEAWEAWQAALQAQAEIDAKAAKAQKRFLIEKCGEVDYE